MPTNDMTYERLMEVARSLKIPPREPSLFGFDYRPGRLAGMDVYVEPEVPKVQLREITLSDGTPLVSKEFRDEYNAWLAARFGYREPLCKDRMLMLGRFGLVVSKQQFGLLNSMIT